MWRALYPLLTRVASPFIGPLLRRRVARGREDPARIQERFGIASLPRPEGRLIWIHGASVGESQSVRPLISALIALDPEIRILLTTMTRSAAALFAVNPPPRTIHQFVPLDRADWMERFLEHWRPQALLLVDTELWPNMIWRARDRRIPMLMVNGRMSARSEARWGWASGLIGDLLSRFSTIFAQSPAEAARFARLGAPTTDYVGNLKFDAPPLGDDPPAREALARAMGDRPRWIAASTHPGEEEFVLDAHKRLLERFPDLLTVIAPRHPERGAQLAAMAEAQGLETARRALSEQPKPETGIYLADTLGELGVFYRLCPIVLVGGGFPGGPGGHNPIEPVLLGRAVLHGPDMSAFDWVCDLLAEAHGAKTVSAPYLADAVADLLADPAAAAALAENGRRAVMAERGAAPVIARRLLDLLAE